jgi:hypothetical protein
VGCIIAIFAIVLAVAAVAVSPWYWIPAVALLGVLVWANS